MQREQHWDARLAGTAMRTEPLGLDRHHRRYWWLACERWARAPAGPGLLGSAGSRQPASQCAAPPAERTSRPHLMSQHHVTHPPWCNPPTHPPVHAGDPGFLFVEDQGGERIGAITTKQQLDEVGGVGVACG